MGLYPHIKEMKHLIRINTIPFFDLFFFCTDWNVLNNELVVNICVFYAISFTYLMNMPLLQPQLILEQAISCVARRIHTIFIEMFAAASWNSTCQLFAPSPEPHIWWNFFTVQLNDQTTVCVLFQKYKHFQE